MYKKYALFLLTMTYILHNIDRFILSILLESIKHEFHVSDAALGLLSGLGYAVFYAALSIPVAIWADRTSRQRIVVLALSFFSLMTVFCGLAVNFMQLVASRLAVGVGESGTHPSSQSMIGDFFKREERGMAMGIFGSGTNIGLLLSFLVGGWINQFYGWRAAFLVVGAPGLILALIIFLTLREPPRGGADGLSGRDSVAPPFREAAAFLWRQPAYLHVVLGGTIVTFVMTGSVNWFAPFLARSYGMASGTIGTLLAFLVGIGGAVGTLGAGYLADRLGRRDVRWNMWVLIWLFLAILPFSISAYLSHDKIATILLFVVPAMATSAVTAPSFAMIQSLAPLRMRGVAAAINLLAIATIAGGLGPLAIGLLSDLLSAHFGTESVRYALLTAVAAIPLAIFHLWRASVTLVADIARADQYNAEAFAEAE